MPKGKKTSSSSSSSSSPSHVPWTDDPEMWYHESNVAYPSEFSSCLREFPVKNQTTGLINWNETEYTEEGWKEKLIEFEVKYPKIHRLNDEGKESTRHETSSFRSRQTSSETVIEYCWNNLKTIQSYRPKWPEGGFSF